MQLIEKLNSFNYTNDFNKSIIIITDGEDHEVDAFKKSKRNLNKGIIFIR